MPRPYFDGVLPFVGLLAALLRQAKMDAQHGDVCALLWLLSDGMAVADFIHPTGGDMLRSWVIQNFEGAYTANYTQSRR